MFHGIQYEYVLAENIKDIKYFNPEIIFHLAAKVTSSDSTEIVEDLVVSNILFGVKLLDVLKDCHELKLFVNIGTFAEYRSGYSHIDNAYLYSATKTAFRTFLDYYTNLCGYKYLHIVPYTIYGGEDSAKKIIDYIKESMDADIPVKMSGGDQVLDFIHIDDVVNFLIYIIKNMHVFLLLKNAETIHIGTGIGTSIRELARIEEKKYGKKANIAWGALPYRNKDVMHAIAPVEKLRMLGWEHKIRLEK